MTDVPKMGGESNNNKIVFSSEDFTQSETVAPMKSGFEKPSDEDKINEKTEASASWLENKRIAMIMAVAGFIVIVIVFGLLFSTIDWDLIMNPPVQ